MAVKYVPFFPEPIEGQALLNQFRRTLRYKGADDMGDKLQRGMPYYEVERQETVGENKSGNLILRGECVSACAYLKEQGIQVDLVYIDPPFASGADYAKKVYMRRNPAQAAAAAEAERALEPGEAFRAFEEKMYGDVWSKEQYLNWMYENLMAIKSVMSETACIYVHLDWHIGHYIKILMDEIFGEDKLLNEIIWCYSIGGKGSNFFGRKHDTIFFYRKGDGYYFDGKNKLVATQRKQNTHMRLKTDEDGREYQEKTDKKSGKVYRYYVDEGKIPEDYWTDIEQLNREDSEREDYATQKPEELLQRIIAASSQKGMLVADFFGGSGVTAAVANRLGRRFIHCDIGINSVQTARDRLVAGGAAFDLLEIKDGVSLYRNPAQTMDKIRQLIPGLKREDGLDSFWAGAISDSRLGMVPVYVPNLMDSTTKLLDEVFINRVLHEAIPDLDSSVKKVIVYYVDIIDRGDIEDFIRTDDSTALEIELRDLKEILDEVVVEDYAEFTCRQTGQPSCPAYTVCIHRFLSDRVHQKIEAFNQKAAANSGKKQPYQPIVVSPEGLELVEFVSLDCTTAVGPWHADREVKIDRFGYVIADGERTKAFWDGSIQAERKPLRLKIRNICGDETVWTL